MSIYTSLLTAGTNSHQETSENANAIATDFVSQGVIGAITNTSGVAPSTGAFAVNAQGTPNMTVAVSSGVMWVQATPSSQGSQMLRVRMTANQNVTISANTSGSTKYDYIYMQIDASKAANPAVDASDVATLVVSRSSSNTADNGTPPTYGYCIAMVTVANSASSITNGNITDKRALSYSTQIQKTSNTYNPYKFSVYQAGAQTVPNGWTKVNLDTVVFDTGGNFNTTTHQFTAPVAGFYRFMGTAGINVPSGTLFANAVNKNTFSSNPTNVGAEIVQGAQTTTGAGFVCCILQLAQGDTVQLYVYNGNASSMSIVTGSQFAWFMGELISAS